MKVLVVLSVLVALTAAGSTSELDSLTAFDFDVLDNNEKERNTVFNCLLDKGPCGDLQKIKDSSIKVLRNKCAECNAEQKAKYDHILQVFHDKYEPVYTELMKKIEVKKE